MRCHGLQCDPIILMRCLHPPCGHTPQNTTCAVCRAHFVPSAHKLSTKSPMATTTLTVCVAAVPVLLSRLCPPSTGSAQSSVSPARVDRKQDCGSLAISIQRLYGRWPCSCSCSCCQGLPLPTAENRVGHSTTDAACAAGRRGMTPCSPCGSCGPCNPRGPWNPCSHAGHAAPPQTCRPLSKKPLPMTSSGSSMKGRVDHATRYVR